MRNLILYSLFGCFLLSCIGNKNKQKIENGALDAIGTMQVAISQTKNNYEEGILEGNDLEFFNPIGIIGTGLVNIKPYIEVEDTEPVHFDKIRIYNDPACQDLFCAYDIDKAWDPPKDKNIIPIYNSIDYGWYCFVCTDSSADFYEVAINKTERKYLKKDRNIEYYTWEGGFEAVFIINPTAENPLRELPSDDAPMIESEVVSDDPEDYYQEVKFQEEWLHIKYEKSGIEGWLRWRRGNDIIVSISISW